MQDKEIEPYLQELQRISKNFDQWDAVEKDYYNRLITGLPGIEKYIKEALRHQNADLKRLEQVKRNLHSIKAQIYIELNPEDENGISDLKYFNKLKKKSETITEKLETAIFIIEERIKGEVQNKTTIKPDSPPPHAVIALSYIYPEQAKDTGAKGIWYKIRAEKICKEYGIEAPNAYIKLIEKYRCLSDRRERLKEYKRTYDSEKRLQQIALAYKLIDEVEYPKGKALAKKEFEDYSRKLKIEKDISSFL